MNKLVNTREGILKKFREFNNTPTIYEYLSESDRGEQHKIFIQLYMAFGKGCIDKIMKVCALNEDDAKSLFNRVMDTNIDKM